MRKKNNHQNLNRRIYNRYIKKRERRRFSNKTVKKTRQALDHMEKSLTGKALKTIGIGDFENFMEYLNNLKYRGKPISESSKINIISQLRLFFEDLREQPGFKRSITKDFMDCWELSPREKQTLRNSKTRKIKKYPKMDEIWAIINKIPEDKITNRRDRALIAFLFLTGARISAAASIPLDLFDPENRTVTQDPNRGVETKFSKKIITTIPNFDKDLYEILVAWERELQSAGFESDSPLFPKAMPYKENNAIEYSLSIEMAKERISAKTAERIVKKACENAGFPQYHAHSFRDSHIYYGIIMARTVRELIAISINVGHETLDTTLREYANLAPEEVHEIILNLSKEEIGNAIPRDLYEKFKDFLRLFDEDRYRKYYDKIDDRTGINSKDGSDGKAV